MASIPISGTNIVFLSGVPFSNDYKHTRWFESLEEQRNYFSNRYQTHSMQEANFQRIEGYNFISVNLSIDQLYGTNYVMFRNLQYNNKWFYGFVTKLEYKQRGTTWVHFEIDVLQTWMFEMNFRESYVVREHCKLWNDDGTPVINTVDEGLNYGTEYDINNVDLYMPNRGLKWLVIIAKTQIQGTDKGKVKATRIGVPQPLSYYVVPFTKDEKQINMMVGGQGAPMSKPSEVMSELYKDTNSVNNIVSIYMTDYIGVGVTIDDSAGDMYVVTVKNPKHVITPMLIGQAENPLHVLYLEDVQNFDYQKDYISDLYEGYTKPRESKLLMYPYTVLTLDDFKGNRHDYKLEYITSKKIEILMKGSLGTSNKVSYGVMNYNKDNYDNFEEEVNNEFAIINNSPQDVPVLTDYLSAYLQGNKNSIENQQKSIIFNGAMNTANSVLAGIGSATSRNPVGAAMGATNAIQGMGDTVLQLQSLQAKQQDIANVPPQINKMGSNVGYDYGNYYSGVYLIRKQIKPEYRKKLEDFFFMFGYKKNELKIPNFHTRERFNYVQTSSCNITGNFNAEDLNDLKRIFDSGITLWHVDDVGYYASGNEVI